ncbi:hypothetical protein BU24DRAFT_417491 [Aaosphaeria arxii CBS 175.79]|uniref:Uncharacterized protein n=1 Tax=Aaosphaeria arxii CBS 175.79 TaxID=1450172 RepID=A0A6A5YAZ0_9PLEO|nr:uncharacterized protein BU24DRAFT_417491 [Aaosphaeria arxii CBS 175.79]KAF2021861.1 hypothetical protein BU24DRAFT_417491 [Aaosphaeria arxii CBS 175.79]
MVDLFLDQVDICFETFQKHHSTPPHSVPPHLGNASILFTSSQLCLHPAYAYLQCLHHHDHHHLHHHHHHQHCPNAHPPFPPPVSTYPLTFAHVHMHIIAVAAISKSLPPHSYLTYVRFQKCMLTVHLVFLLQLYAALQTL